MEMISKHFDCEKLFISSYTLVTEIPNSICAHRQNLHSLLSICTLTGSVYQTRPGQLEGSR